MWSNVKYRHSSTRERLTFDDFKLYFYLRESDAAKAMGISTTKLKIAKNKVGITRWPFRTFSAVHHIMRETLSTHDRTPPASLFIMIKDLTHDIIVLACSSHTSNMAKTKALGLWMERFDTTQHTHHATGTCIKSNVLNEYERNTVPASQNLDSPFMDKMYILELLSTLE